MARPQDARAEGTFSPRAQLCEERARCSWAGQAQGEVAVLVLSWFLEQRHPVGPSAVMRVLCVLPSTRMQLLAAVLDRTVLEP